jgi:ketosteroid isomerase-like protein
VGASEVEVVRSIYRAWAEETSARELVDPAFEYVNPPDAVEPGTLHGRGSLEKVREVYPDFRVEPERYFDCGDRVLVVGVARGTTESGLTTQWRQGYVWTVRDGKAVSLAWFNDPRQALEAVGLDDWPEPAV